MELVMERCLFCNDELTPGSEEHVFLSAIGGRVATYRATCQLCNNAFANDQTGKIDDALAEGFRHIRNGLNIWSGRNKAPPTLLKAGALENGAEFDLAPGFVPLMRPGRIPPQLPVGTEHQFIARDDADARRMIDILSKRGVSAEIPSAMRVSQKVPPMNFSLSFDGPKIWRCIAKSAVVGFVVLYGNEQARAFISTDLRGSIRYGAPQIDSFAGWDFTNEWPSSLRLEAHPRTPNVQPSGFEHSLIVTDVREWSVAYVTLFGSWRFSVVLGPRTELPVRGLAVDPRATAPARFMVSAQAPTTYVPKKPGSFASEHDQVLEGNRLAFERALRQWSKEAHQVHVEELAIELEASILAAGEGDSERALAIETFARKLAAIEHGGGWETELGTSFNEDNGVAKTAV